MILNLFWSKSSFSHVGGSKRKNKTKQDQTGKGRREAIRKKEKRRKVDSVVGRQGGEGGERRRRDRKKGREVIQERRYLRQ